MQTSLRTGLRKRCYLRRSSEGHFVHIHVGRNGSPCSRPVPRDNVHHARRKPCLQGAKWNSYDRNEKKWDRSCHSVLTLWASISNKIHLSDFTIIITIIIISFVPTKITPMVGCIVEGTLLLRIGPCLTFIDHCSGDGCLKWHNSKSKGQSV